MTGSGIGTLFAGKWSDDVILVVRHITRLCHNCSMENQ